MMETTFRKVQTSPLKKLLCLGIKTKATGKTNRLSRLWDFQTHRLQACFLIIITNLNINKFFRINLNTHNQDFFPSPRHSGSLLKYQCKKDHEIAHTIHTIPYSTGQFYEVHCRPTDTIFRCSSVLICIEYEEYRQSIKLV